MLGLIFLYFVGKSYYDLARKHNKIEWRIAVLGIVTFYTAMYFGSFIIAIIGQLAFPDFINGTSENILNALGIPIGMVACWLAYRHLNKTWSTQTKSRGQSIDSDLIQPPADRYNQGDH